MLYKKTYWGFRLNEDLEDKQNSLKIVKNNVVLNYSEQTL
jgi:hypothetical protein